MRSPLDKFVLMALLAAAAGSVAAQPYVFPSKGQSAEQQQKDEQYCYNWAVQQTGYNPAYRQPAPSGTPSPERGSGAKGALVGGALGAIVGDSSKSAATGAVIGGIGNRMYSRHKQSQAQSQQQAADANAQQSFNRARATCLTGLGYTVN